jgi:hypothetical protein
MATTLRERYARDGFLLRKKALTASKLSGLMGIIDGIMELEFEIEESVPAFLPEDFKGRMKLISRLPVVYDVEREMRGIAHLAGIKNPCFTIPPLFRCDHPRITYHKHDYYHTTPWHQDWTSHYGSLNSVTVWVALRDMEFALGPLEVIPGSHLHGVQRHRTMAEGGFGEIEESTLSESVPLSTQAISVPLVAGDALVLSSFLIHRSGKNTTENTPRLSLQYRYSDVDDPYFSKMHYYSPFNQVREGVWIPTPPKQDIQERFDVVKKR